MANQITGKVLYIYPAETIVGKSGNSIEKRAIIIDCTRFDPYTGERGYENTPMMEFVGERCRELDSFQVGQIVTITFDIQGTRYKNAEGREQIFTRIHPYKIELKQMRQSAPQQQPAQQPTPQPVQQPTPQPVPQQPTQQSLYNQQGYQQDFPPRVDGNGQPLPF